MSRSRYVAVALSLAMALGVLGCSRAPARPNVVLIVIDALRADHLGAYGWKRAQTPRLDGLAAHGTRFTAARAPSSWTLPSVASILTGRYPAEHGVERPTSALGAKHVTIAEALSAAGYETAAFSANVSAVVPESGFGQGFDRFEVLEAPPDAERTDDPVLVRDGTNGVAQAAAADVVTDAVLKWKAARQDPGRPYFLYVHYFDPHARYAPPDVWATRFGVAPDDPLRARGQAMVAFGSKPPDTPALATLLSLYDAEIAFTDAEVGRLLDGLGIQGLGAATPDAVPNAPPAYVVVTADHGEEFGDHGGMLHGRTLFEELVRVPLLVAGGDLTRGRVVDVPVSLASVAATVADLAHATLPEGGGRSLVPILRNAPPPAEIVFAELALPNALHRSAAIDGSWKLLLGRGFQPSLYDLSADPGERTDRERGTPQHSMPLQKALGEHNKAGFKARAVAPPEERTLDADRGRAGRLGTVK